MIKRLIEAVLLFQLLIGARALVTHEEFTLAVTGNGFKTPTKEQYEAFEAGLPDGEITTKEEAAMFLAQILHESLGLTRKIEIGCAGDKKPNCRPYKDDKCDAKGQRYYGRGYIQLTLCDNYKRASTALGLGDSLVKNPDQVAQNEELAWKVSFWYWRTRVHKRATTGEFGLTTVGINPNECKLAKTKKGTEFLKRAKRRFQMYEKIFSTFKLEGEPKEEGCYN